MHKLFASTAAIAVIAFMSDICETVMVTVKGSSDPIRVNKSDYDRDQSDDGEKRYTLNKSETKKADEQEGPKTTASPVTNESNAAIPPAPSAPNFGNPVAPSTPNEDTYNVGSVGTGKNTKYYVIRVTDGQKVTGFRDVNEDGYKTAEEAWTAILAVKKQPFEQQISPPPGMPASGELPPQT